MRWPTKRLYRVADCRAKSETFHCFARFRIGSRFDFPHRLIIPFVVAVVLTTAREAPAQIFESVGTRAMGMAGAFVAVADDATAVYWNPAGLATGAFLSLIVDRQITKSWLDRRRVAAPATDDTSVFVGLSMNTTGFAYYRLRTNQVTGSLLPGAAPATAGGNQGGETILRSLITHHVAVTRTSIIFPGISLGTTLRYIRVSAASAPGGPALAADELLGQADDLERWGKHEYDLDIGLMVGSPTVRVGVVARNLRGPSFSVPNGGSLRLDRQIRAGVAMRSFGGLLVAADIDLTRVPTVSGHRRSLAVGGEHWFGQRLGVRGGSRLNLEANAPQPVGAFGFSVALSSGAYLDGQVTRGRDALEQGWSIAGRFGF